MNRGSKTLKMQLEIRTNENRKKKDVNEWKWSKRSLNVSSLFFCDDIA